MTNFDAWQLYMKDVTSPQSYVDFGFYYLISATLQRRVWVGPDHQKLYPNVYVILVGEPGIGKGLVLKQVSEFLREHKLPRPGMTGLSITDENLTDKVAAEAVLAANFVDATSDGTKKKGLADDPLLLPVAANATTFESLVNTCANATRRINYKVWDQKSEKKVMRIYTHASICFCLEEISSLFRHHSEDVVNFLITAYDCGDYEYKTKNSGHDYVQRPCVCFLGGTTPSFIESTFNDRLLTDGFSSRTWFIWASQNRKFQIRMPALTQEQKDARAQIAAHIKKLTGIYGHVKFSPDAERYLDSWWQQINTDLDYRRPNTNDKLNAYYSRKNIHVQKMAMAVHFGEHADVDPEDNHSPFLEIQLDTLKRAIELLETQERLMHMALQFDGINPLFKASKKIVKFLKQHGAKSSDDLIFEFFSDVTKEELNTILDHLQRTKQIALNSAMQWTAKVKE